ncbi:MAG: Ppx/GppA family phosphatase [bacterium]
MSRLAAIDIGTNTALLLVAEVSDKGEIRPLYQEEKIVRLGEGVDKNKKLSEQAIARTLRALRAYFHLAAQFHAERVLITGTSAVRDAANRSELIHQIKSEFGVELQILSGAKEARVTYFGALSNKPHLQGEILLIDIGGGSTECILGDNLNIHKSKSIDIGSVRLTERFIKKDPISDREFRQLRSAVQNQIDQHFSEWQTDANHFVGVAGTVTTLAAMHLKLSNYVPEKVDKLTLTALQIAHLVEELKSKTLAEKKNLPGLQPERADVILAGGMILLEIMRAFKMEQVIVSDRGLRYGVLNQFVKEQKKL